VKASLCLPLLLVAAACGEEAEPAAASGGMAGATSSTGARAPVGGAGNAQSGGATGGSASTPSGGTAPATAGSAGAPSTSAGSGGSIPIIDGPAPPAITFDEYAIPNPSQPGWITTGPDDNLWFTHQSTAPSAISKVAKEGTPFNRYNTSTTNTGPRGIAPGPDGNVWYTKQGGVGRMQPGGQMNEYGVPNGGDSAGIALGPDGNLWFTQQLHNKVSRVTPSAEFKEFAVPTANSGPLAITAGKDGNLWFTEAAVTGNKIARITPAGEVTEFAIPTPAANPTGIAQGPGDELWFTEHDVAKIGKITPEGVVTEFYIPSKNAPSRIVAGPDGNLWFTLPGSANAIGRITPLGQVSEYPVPTQGSDPYDITVGPDGALWFTELSSNKVGRISNLTGGGTVMAVEGGANGGELGGDTTCTRDTDCKESGKACGGDVCGSAKLCVLAVSGDPGSCVADTDCWCKGQGATCAAGHCSFTTPSGGQ
jgi:streptogramin lyase